MAEKINSSLTGEPSGASASDGPAWLPHYPAGVGPEVDVGQYSSLVDLIDECVTRYADRVAYSFMGADISYASLDALSRAFAAYLQSLGLARGDRVGIMMPNVPQYPVAVAGILRAGYVVVNINPLYTPRELEFQLRDSGARAIVIIENFASTLEKCIAATPVKHVVLCSVGDQLGWLRGLLVNCVVRYVKKMVPAFTLPLAVAFNDAVSRGRGMPLHKPAINPGDVAVLQYTGGTTGVSKGAVLLHRNIVANVLQCEAWYMPALNSLPPEEQITTVCALPLYHIFAFTLGMMMSLRMGGKAVLIINPRDIPGTLKDLVRHRVHILPAVNTLFNALVRDPAFHTVDWSHLRISGGGGSAVQSEVAKLWHTETGSVICEGYGLTETSPVAICNLVNAAEFSGGVGYPLPSTDVRLLDDEGRPVGFDQPGEIVIRGPQVMAGYWQRPDETARVMTTDGYLRTGDIGTMDASGFIKVIDRKKDMILVSGFNVYPNEIEDVVGQMPGVMECACVGVANVHSGEAVKLVIVRSDPHLTEADIREYCKQNLTGYKQPKLIEFRDGLPKTPVGKVLRRALRD